MTDKEIMQALECCTSKSISCQKCPLLKKSKYERKLIHHSFDLINRQQAEIEKARAEAIKEFAEKLKEEIEQALESNYTAKAERMSKTNDCTDTFVICCIGKILALSDINDYIDNLVKEMVGGEND